ncbi:hypothetical protein [Eubacterium sp. 1001713B170207_170306_E7]|uniref:hypothetical protein n=1 Tax=Eubacterium sp. 1001713B170207_170306_E7 TaxID=2787097 RepID=UPI001899DE11|nr:hypothetical protein [Eubacterium sp. 1001713B170207_170306_E7]
MDKNRQKKLFYSEIMVIAHGKTEFLFCQSIKANLRIPMIIESNNKGRSSIEITGILKYLETNYYLKNKKNFSSFYETIEYDKKTRMPVNFSIYPIMDLEENYDMSLIKKYKNGHLFDSHWLKTFVHPIYNDHTFEDVFKEANLSCAQNDKDKGNYNAYFRELFLEQTGKECIEMLIEKFKKTEKTNMELFLEHCLKIQEKRALLFR